MSKPKIIKFSATEKKLMSQLLIREKNEIVKNPFSKEEVELEPLAVALYDFIKGYERLLNSGGTHNIRMFDTARYLFQKQFPDEYMKLLD